MAGSYGMYSHGHRLVAGPQAQKSPCGQGRRRRVSPAV
nr:MAG TPA: hypothetical protein [Caudoviricetes sp.]